MAVGPNILFLMCDSMDGRAVDPSSHVSRYVHTPTLDALAKDGVNFVRTCAAPKRNRPHCLCIPRPAQICVRSQP